jgi:4-hydroxy-tetrahydrodipicolinate synthase
MPSLPDQGIIPALWTPTDAAGRVIESALRAQLERVAAAGVQGLMVLGSTGEFPLLALPERQRVLALVKRHAPLLPAMAHVSDIRLPVVIELGRQARDLGYEAMSLLPPWYFARAQEDLVEFFARAGEACDLPLFVYNYPERTGNRLALETIAAITERVRVAGVKQSGAEFSYLGDLVALGGQRGFVVLTGADTRLAEALSLGCSGCVSGIADALPRLMVRVYGAFRERDPHAVAAATAQVQAVGDLLDSLEFPLNIGALIEAAGLPAGEFKSPVSSQTRARQTELVGKLRRLIEAKRLD